MDLKKHWEEVYSTKTETEVSWYQDDPKLSLNLIPELVPATGRIIDVGGGASLLVDRLLAAEFDRLAVLDVSQAALERAKSRLGQNVDRVQWIVADITGIQDVGQFDLWHDRAVFHFLTDPAERAAYVTLLSGTVPTGGHVIIATFALDGPEKCSGLPVQRYDGQSLTTELGAGFEFLKSLSETHLTPWGKPQAFQYSVFRRASFSGHTGR